MYKTGLVFGKFYPLHNGHINLVNRAAMQCEKLFVILSYDSRNMKKDSEFMGIKPITLQDQLKWLSYTFKDIPHITVKYIDEVEREIPEYPNGWGRWSTEIIKELGFVPDAIFTSDKDYISNLRVQFSSHIVLVDQNKEEFPISATLIRKNGIYKYWEYLPAIVRRHFLLKVAIMGIESTGKTTLCKYLAKRYSTSYVAEYGRDYVVNELGGNELALVYDDFPKIAYGHKIRQNCEEKTANKILFIDTTALETQMYCIRYTNRESDVLKEIIKNEDYDLYLIEKTEGTVWVPDGIRINNSWGHRNCLDNIFETLVGFHLSNKNNLIYLSGNYLDRFNQAINAIENCFKIKR